MKGKSRIVLTFRNPSTEALGKIISHTFLHTLHPQHLSGFCWKIVVTPGNRHTKIEKGVNESKLPYSAYEKDREASRLVPANVVIGDFCYTPIKEKHTNTSRVFAWWLFSQKHWALLTLFSRPLIYQQLTVLLKIILVIV